MEIEEFYNQVSNGFDFSPVIVIQAQEVYTDEFFLRMDTVLSAIRLINRNSNRIPVLIFSGMEPTIVHLTIDFSLRNLDSVYARIREEKYGCNNIRELVEYVYDYAIVKDRAVAFIFTYIPVKIPGIREVNKSTGNILPRESIYIPIVHFIEIYDYLSLNDERKNFSVIEIEPILPKTIREMDKFIYLLFRDLVCDIDTGNEFDFL